MPRTVSMMSCPSFFSEAADIDLDRIAFDFIVERIKPLFELCFGQKHAGTLH